MIESPSEGLCYYGSTCMQINKRLHQHRKCYKLYKENKYTYITSYKVLDCIDHKIILVEEYPCENKQQLVAREAYFIRHHPCVNKFIPGRTNEQYRQDNREIILEKKKMFYQNNKEKIHQKLTCICGVSFSKYNKARHEKSITHQSFIDAQQ